MSPTIPAPSPSASSMPALPSSAKAPVRNSDCCRPPSHDCSVRPEIPGTSRTPRAVHPAPPPERPFIEEVGRDPGRLRIAFTDKSPYGEAIDPEIAAATREIASLLAGLGHHVEERAPVLAADPAAVMAIIVAANTALNVR